MTEEEVKTKWCPMARPFAQFEAEVGANRNNKGEIIDGAKCIASDCMMWVKDIQGVRKEDGDMEFIKTSQGHCGLAK